MLEAELLRNLSHPNIVTYVESFIDNGFLIIIMEYCELKDLACLINSRRAKDQKFTETEIMNYFIQLCLSIEYVHSRQILHRDLKS